MRVTRDRFRILLAKNFLKVALNLCPKIPGGLLDYIRNFLLNSAQESNVHILDIATIDRASLEKATKTCGHFMKLKYKIRPRVAPSSGRSLFGTSSGNCLVVTESYPQGPFLCNASLQSLQRVLHVLYCCEPFCETFERAQFEIYHVSGKKNNEDVDRLSTRITTLNL